MVRSLMISRVFIFGGMHQRYLYRPWCRPPLVSPLSTSGWSGRREARDMLAFVGTKFSLNIGNWSKLSLNTRFSLFDESTPRAIWNKGEVDDALGMIAQIGYQWGWLTSDNFGLLPWILFEGRVKVFLGASEHKSLLQLLRKPLLKYLPHVGTSSNYSLYNKLDPTLRRTRTVRV